MFKPQSSKDKRFKPQWSKVKGTYHKVQCSNLKVQRIKGSNLKVQRIKGLNHKDQRIKIISVISEIRSCYDFAIKIRKNRNMYSNFFYILVDERVGERVKNVLLRSLCKCFIIN